jgi:hypothetical protein
MNDMLEQAIESAGANLFFGVIVLALLCGLAMLAMFVYLWLRHAWRWLARHSWRDVILSVERRAFRRERAN